ncbi:CRISPR-associated protein Cas4 [Nitratidesulfovibrio termitidis]|uniref:CRISPR-associated protein Cas4 n=1 Tax=Nitratidesulfovibrio termitidis TaxID=42252 RepID=UPI00040F21B4|nr:CRISPR-associated protein Cas4 [Nitratidesulfovibrio termitidis]
MYPESDLLPVSALQHLIYCPRQCALIHIEQVWDDNVHTALGNILHERVDRPGMERRRGVRTEFGVPLRSLALGLAGRADAVEFAADGPCPVEYKQGRPKRHAADHIQLCAQAMCLEEMTGRTVPQGVLFYAATRQRQTVELDEHLRRQVRETAMALHALVATGVTPQPEPGPKCKGCSLADRCRPGTFAQGGRSAARYLAQARRAAHDEDARPGAQGGVPDGILDGAPDGVPQDTRNGARDVVMSSAPLQFPPHPPRQEDD